MKKFLKPFLFICLGLVITTIVFANVRIAAERPSPPRNLNVDCVTANSCTISYKAPLHDGGSPIISYKIECKEHDSNVWVNKGVSAGLSHDIINMRKGTRALIRVTASNSVGESDPVETKEEILFEDKFIAR